jgi:hypothetical protein
LGGSKGHWVLLDLDRGDQPAVRDLVLEGLRERRGDAFDASMNPDLGDSAATERDDSVAGSTHHRVRVIDAHGLVPMPFS